MSAERSGRPRRAAEHDATSNALEPRHLDEIAKNQTRVKQAMRELREMSDRSAAEVGPITWTRDELHAR